MIPRIALRWLALLLALIMPAACASPWNRFLVDNLPFDSNSPNAIVVIGMAGSGQLDGTDFVGWFYLKWRRTTPDEQGRPVFFMAIRRGLSLRAMQRTAYLVDPGVYVLADIEMARVNVGEVITPLTPPPTVRLEAGQITYIGDFTIDAAAVSAKLAQFGHDDDAARAVMQDFSSVKGELRYVPPTVTRAKP